MSAQVSKEIKFFVDRSRREPAISPKQEASLGLEADRLAAKVLPDSPAATAQQFTAAMTRATRPTPTGARRLQNPAQVGFWKPHSSGWLGAAAREGQECIGAVSPT